MGKYSNIIAEIITIYRKMRKGRENQNIYRMFLNIEPIEVTSEVEDDSCTSTNIYNFARFKDLRDAKYYISRFGSSGVQLTQSEDILNDANLLDTEEPFWLNIFGPDESDLRMLGELYKVHDISLADICEKDTEEKVEVFRHYTFISLKLLSCEVLRPSEDIDFNILIFKNFIITTHDKLWSGIHDVVNFLSLICEYTSFCPDWVVYSVVIEFLQDIKDIVRLIRPDVERNIGQGENLEHLLRMNFDTANSLFSLRSFIKPKKQILNSIAQSSRFKKKMKKVFEMALEDFSHAEEQTREYTKTLERSQDLILALVDMKQTKEANDMNKMINRFSFMAFAVLPFQVITGLWGMNVEVPFKDIKSLGPFFSLCITGALMSFFLFLAEKLANRKSSRPGTKVL